MDLQTLVLTNESALDQCEKTILFMMTLMTNLEIHRIAINL